MPVLDRYILFSFLRTFISFFLILMLIFVVQTVWVFIDEFAGKGLDITVLLRFLVHGLPTKVPMSAITMLPPISQASPAAKMM